MHNLLISIFEKINQEDILYCLIRDGDRAEYFSEGGEIDLLVSRDQFFLLANLLERFHFIRLPDWGHSPHHFFISYDSKSDSWLKFDVVTEIAYGRSAHNLRTSLAENCLNHRYFNGKTYVLSPEDELVTLLLHCVLDKGYFSAVRKARLKDLRLQVTNGAYVTKLLSAYWLPETPWQHLVDQIEAENWDALLKNGKRVASHLARGDELGVAARALQSKILLKLNTWIGKLPLKSPWVAILAPDGAGKSTLSTRIKNSFYFPVHIIYMGLYQKGDKVSGFSFLPGSGLVKKLVRQWARCLAARYYQKRGRLVIFDRYTYDALLTPKKHMGTLRRWRRWLLAYACPAPDLVILLDAPGELLYERKGEHSPEFLERQRQSYLDLKSEIAELVILDARNDPEVVRRQATALIWKKYLRRSDPANGQNEKKDSMKHDSDKYLQFQ